jgi:glycosyltransferase involved in cell wall biosynthesis
MEMSDIIIVPSDFLNEVFKKFGLNAKVIPNIADIEEFPFKYRDKFRPRFVVARHLEPIYNVECAIRCFAHILDRFPHAILKIAGNGTDESSLRAYVRELDLNGSVKFLGNVNRSEIVNLYDEVDIFLNSSNVDNMPIAILEAMASGLPVVSTNAGGIPYLVQDGRTGFLVNLNDHQAMAKKIIQLLESPVMARNIVKEARQYVEVFCWDNVKKQWLAEYKKVLKVTKTK